VALRKEGIVSVSVEAGWYEDPQAAGKLRWWDGQSWTDHFADAPTQPEPTAGVSENASDPGSGGRWPVPTDVDLSGLHKKAIEALVRDMHPEEVVRVVILGASAQAIIGTDTRAFIFKKGILAGASFGSELTSWEYRHLVGVQTHTGMMSGAVVLQASGQSGKKTSYWGNDDDDTFKAPNAIPIARPFEPAVAGASALRRLVMEASRPAPAAPVPPASPESRPESTATSALSQLQQLAELRAAGVLNDHDFEVMKNRIVHGQ
jgi:hypothetical protein